MKKNTFNIISKITKLFAVGLILCAAIIGCNMGNSVKYGHDSGKARLILSKDAASRLIAPSAVTEDDITKVELFAKLSSASTAPVNPIKTWSSISAMESENRLYIDAGCIGL